MGYLFLILTILSETAAVLFMKASHGFKDKPMAAAAIVTYALSFVFLTLAFKSLPVGIANAIWAGASTVLVAILGIYLFKEQLSVWQWVSLGLVILGLIGLNWESKPEL